MTECIAIGDIHLNLRKDKEWEAARFKSLFVWLEKQPATQIFILGDTFDVPKPNLDEIALFYECVALLRNKKVYVIDGNHEAITKTESVFHKIPQVGFRYIYNDQIKIEGIRVHLVSWTALGTLPKMIETGLSSLPKCLMTHVRCNVPPHIKEEIPLQKVSEAFNTVIAGDIHLTGYKPFDNFYYTGQPYSTKYKQKGLHSVLKLVFDRRGLVVKPIHTVFPNKVLITTQVGNIPVLNNTDKFKVRVEGSIAQLESLTNKDNIIYDKIIADVDTSTVTLPQGRINIKTAITQTLRNADVHEDSLNYGETFIEESIC